MAVNHRQPFSSSTASLRSLSGSYSVLMNFVFPVAMSHFSLFFVLLGDNWLIKLSNKIEKIVAYASPKTWYRLSP